MLKELIQKQKQQLDYFFSHFNLTEGDALLQEMKECTGVLFFTGIGKSGFIAQKVAATMQSTGTKAFFLPPIDALHGDLGMVNNKDMVCILSKSGETEELLQLLPFLRNKGARIVAITSNGASRLGHSADKTLLLPCSQELCPFDLAPTISTTIQLLLGDLLAVALMEAKKFSLAQFAENHPNGRIGRRTTLRVRDLMLDRERTPLCFSEDLLEKVLEDFNDKRCGCLIVINEQKQLKGIFTDGDLRRALQLKGEEILKEKMGQLITCSPKAIEEEALAWEALKLMEADQKFPVMVLPVLDIHQNVVGIIKMHDLIQAGL